MARGTKFETRGRGFGFLWRNKRGAAWESSSSEKLNLKLAVGVWVSRCENHIFGWKSSALCETKLETQWWGTGFLVEKQSWRGMGKVPAQRN